jgi:hypothetical protein
MLSGEKNCMGVERDALKTVEAPAAPDLVQDMGMKRGPGHIEAIRESPEQDSPRRRGT